MRPSFLFSFRNATILLTTVVGVGLYSAAHPASAGPVTGGSSTSPYLEAAIYQGVIAVIPGNTGDSILEIGAVGKDIASSGDIFFRPQSLIDANAAVRFAKNGTSGKTDLHVRGRLCLNGSCKDAWPVPGGTSYWAQSGTWLEPITVGRGVFSNTVGGSGAVTLEIYGEHSDGTLFARHTGGGTAIDIGGYAEIHGNVYTTGDISVLDCLRTLTEDCTDLATYVPANVWHPGNDGRGSGLDAGKIEGYDFRICPPNTCIGLTNDNRWWICGDIGLNGATKCILLP